MDSIAYELKIFGIRLLGVIILSPLMGYLLLLAFEKSQKEWKSGSRRKKWIIMSGVFFMLAGISGWLR